MSIEKKPIPADLQIPRRFTAPQRIEHALLVVSFTILGITGLVQKFATNPTGSWLMDKLGGIHAVRINHRGAAIAFIALGLWHIIILGHRIFVRRVAMTMLPTWKDFGDALHVLRYNLLLTQTRPRMPRYSFVEKLEYWSLIWGSIITGATGLILLKPLSAAKILPAQFIPAAKAAHGGEAVLAVLAIIIWHFYHVHIKTFNKSIFTGKLTGRQIEEEHGDELNQVLAGERRPIPDLQAMRHRMILYIPIAIVTAAVSFGILYWATTSETTAILNLSPLSHPEIAITAKASLLPSSGASAVSAPLIPHSVSDRKKCTQCHGRTGTNPMPAHHKGRPIESCEICHKSAREKCGLAF
jgi:cytochrome b subunit of formate dehydrogenase